MSKPLGLATILFTDVVGSTLMRTERGDVAADKLLAEAEELVAITVVEHDGTLVKSLGDGQLVAFASPRNALGCAVEVQRALAERNPGRPGEELVLRMGLNTGEVSWRGSDVLGEAVNAAARIADKAKPSEILISEVVRGLVGTVPGVTFKDRGRLALKGFPQRWRLYEILWRPEDQVAAEPRRAKGGSGARSGPRPRADAATRRARSADRSLDGFVNREDELARMSVALDECLAGRGSLTTLEGPSGIGKTRLAAVIAAKGRAAGVSVAWGRCWEGGGAPAFWSWTQALRELIDQLEPGDVKALAVASPRLAQIVPELGADAGVGTGSFEVFDAAARFVKAAARIRPLLLVFDDVHAADEDSLRLIEFVGRELHACPVMIVAAFADDVVGPNEPVAGPLDSLARCAQRLQLKPFDEAAVGALYREITGKDPGDAILSVLYEATEGMPYFVDQAVRLLESEGSLRRPDHSLGFRVPQGAKGILQRRLGSLSDAAKRILAIAAVIGREFDASTVWEVSGTSPDEVYDLLGEAVQAGVVREVSALGRFSFAHVLLRETLYEDLAMSDRMKLHRSVAEVLEKHLSEDTQGKLGEVAHHYFKAAQAGDKTKTFEYTIQAAGQAAAAGATGEAIRLYERALKVAGLGGVASIQRSRAEKAVEDLRAQRAARE